MKLKNVQTACQIFSLFFILVKSDQNLEEISLLLDNLLDVLLTQINICQAILFSIEGVKDKSGVIDFLVHRKVITRYPTQNYGFYKSVQYCTNDLGQLKWLNLNRSSILFVTALEYNAFSEPVEKKIIEDLRTISKDTYRSKYLLFIFDEAEQTFENLLKFAWKNRLLDFDICEITVKSNSSSFLYNNPDNWSFSMVIHQYNPFTDTYTRKSKTKMFPITLNDLYGSEIKVGVVNYQPYMDVEMEPDGKVQNYFGVDGEMLTAIRQSLNFKIVPEVHQISGYGVLLPNGSATGLLAKIGREELDLIAFRAFYFFADFNVMVDRSAFFTTEQLCAVAPMIHDTSFLLSPEMINSIVTIAVLISIIWLFSIILRSRKMRQLWQPFNIGFLILGISVSGQPTKLRERFLYSCILIISLFYSSNVFAQLTSVNVNLQSYKSFDTIGELYESGLTPMLHPNFANMTFQYAEGDLKKLEHKALKLSTNQIVCPSWLMTYANVTCMLENSQISLLLRVHKNKMKKTKLCFWTATRAFILSKASPYSESFNRKISLVFESGIQQWWEINYDYKYAKSRNVSIIDGSTDSLFNKLKDTSYNSSLTFCLLGLLVSSIVFLGEIFYFKVKLRFPDGRRANLRKWF